MPRCAGRISLLPRPFLPHLLIPLLLLLLPPVAGAAAADPGASRSGLEDLPPAGGTAREPLPAPSFPAAGDTIRPDSLEEYLPDADPARWDSVMAAYDAEMGRGHAREVVPRYSFRYDKAEGLHLALGAAVHLSRYRIHDLELLAGYDFGRERPNVDGRVAIDLDGAAVWRLEAQGHDGVRPYGLHRPYGNTWLALVSGYDAMQYLRERAWGASFSYQPTGERQVWLGWVRLEHDPLPAVSRRHLFGSDRWMRWNEPADHLVANGIRARVRRAPAYLDETIYEGLVADTRLHLFGGNLLGSSPEFSVVHTDLWYAAPTPAGLDLGGNSLHLRGSGTLALGDAPWQAFPDLGGDAGLRAFPPRGFGTGDTLVGHGRLLARLEFRTPAAYVRRSRVPLLRRLGLRLAPFVEAGAVWGRERAPAESADGTQPGDVAPGARPRIRPIREWDDLRGPRRSEIRWDLGIGVRRDIDFTGILSAVQVDFAWPMGADTGPVRITARFSKDGLD